MAKAHAQLFATGGGCLRLWQDDSKSYEAKDPPDLSLALETLYEQRTIVVHGLDRADVKIGPPQWRALKQAVADTGKFDRAEFDRYQDGRHRRRPVELNKSSR
jgi:hypothetical protein